MIIDFPFSLIPRLCSIVKAFKKFRECSSGTHLRCSSNSSESESPFSPMLRRITLEQKLPERGHEEWAFLRSKKISCLFNNGRQREKNSANQALCIRDCIITVTSCETLLGKASLSPFFEENLRFSSQRGSGALTLLLSEGQNLLFGFDFLEKRVERFESVLCYNPLALLG
jgi:hypothetical protein